MIIAVCTCCGDERELELKDEETFYCFTCRKDVPIVLKKNVICECGHKFSEHSIYGGQCNASCRQIKRVDDQKHIRTYACICTKFILKLKDGRIDSENNRLDI
jgi:hypothetical protein